MASKSSKAIPFLVMLIATGFGAVETFTNFSISTDLVNLLATILTPLALGGVANKAFSSWQSAKKQSIPTG